MDSILLDKKLLDHLDTFFDGLRATDPKVIVSLKDGALVAIAIELNAIRKILSLKFPII